MQLANERSILDERVMENQRKMDFIEKEIYTNPFRFAQPSTFGGQRNLSNVQGDSLYLPSFNQLYDKEIKLERDSIDVPIVDASNEFKSPVKQEVSKLNETINTDLFMTPESKSNDSLNEAFSVDTATKENFNKLLFPEIDSKSILEDDAKSESILEEAKITKVDDLRQQKIYNDMDERFKEFQKSEDYQKSPVRKEQFRSFGKADQINLLKYAQTPTKENKLLTLNTYYNKQNMGDLRVEVMYELSKKFIENGGFAINPEQFKDRSLQEIKEFFEFTIQTYSAEKAPVEKAPVEKAQEKKKTPSKKKKESIV